MRRLNLALLAALAVLSGGLYAIPSRAVQAEKGQDSAKGITVALITQEVVAELRDALANPLVAASIAMQNEKRRGITQAQIEALDATWVQERDNTRKPLIAATLSSPLSIYLTRVQARSLGLYAEMIVMDSYGLNVGQSAITSDYWQGDEAKWQRTYPVGAYTVFIDDAEWHDETRTWRAQVSLSVADPDTGQAIGAATIELNLTELQRRAFDR